MDNGVFKVTIITKNNEKTIIAKNKNLNNSQKINETEGLLEKFGLESVKFTEFIPEYKKIKNGDNILNENCSICHEKYNINEYKRHLCCVHYFHKKCIDKWLINNPNCPMCRKDIMEVI